MIDPRRILKVLRDETMNPLDRVRVAVAFIKTNHEQSELRASRTRSKRKRDEKLRTTLFETALPIILSAAEKLGAQSGATEHPDAADMADRYMPAAEPEPADMVERLRVAEMDAERASLDRFHREVFERLGIPVEARWATVYRVLTSLSDDAQGRNVIRRVLVNATDEATRPGQVGLKPTFDEVEDESEIYGQVNGYWFPMGGVPDERPLCAPTGALLPNVDTAGLQDGCLALSLKLHGGGWMPLASFDDSPSSMTLSAGGSYMFVPDTPHWRGAQRYIASAEYLEAEDLNDPRRYAVKAVVLAPKGGERVIQVRLRHPITLAETAGFAKSDSAVAHGSE